jgi:hypothetical protein
MKTLLFVVAVCVVLVSFFYFTEQGYFVQAFYYGLAALIAGRMSGEDVDE